MKAITLWQPWASLITLGVKAGETRNWPAPDNMIGARIAIHAAKREVRMDDVTPDILDVLEESGYYHRHRGFSLPLGAIVCTARLGGVFPTDGTELDPYGDYSLGRYYWDLEDVEALELPIPARGRQGFWEWESWES